jgi:hypothetical protein
MQAAGLTPDTICRSIDKSIIQYLPNDRERGEVIRVLRRMLKNAATDSTGTIESDEMEDAGHSSPPRRGGRGSLTLRPAASVGYNSGWKKKSSRNVRSVREAA